MDHHLSEPALHVEPTPVGPGTYVVHEVQHALDQPLSVFLNSMVIQAREPVVVDTGTARNRRRWCEDVFGIVEPRDVRWIFLSHDDADHTGNLAEVMAACPNATLVCSWAITERFANAFEFPLDRCRWVDDGGSFDVGDRSLVALRPPMYDSPATRGLLDARTGVYWAADSFPTPVPGGPGAMSVPCDVGELDPDLWSAGMATFAHHALAPWLRLVEPSRWADAVERVRRHPISAIASGHSPVITGPSVDAAFDLALRLPDSEPLPAPGQLDLERILDARARPPAGSSA